MGVILISSHHPAYVIAGCPAGVLLLAWTLNKVCHLNREHDAAMLDIVHSEATSGPAVNQQQQEEEHVTLSRPKARGMMYLAAQRHWHAKLDRRLEGRNSPLSGGDIHC